MKILRNIAGIALIAAVVAWAVYNFVPFSILQFEKAQPRNFGSTITTILGSDTISGSRTTINNNFAALNATKAEISAVSSTTSLPFLAQVGTLTSGALGSGFTAVNVPQGGTGSTTLSSNQVLLGNGTGNIKVVSGYGSSGQFLTSGGNGVAPTWTTGAVDQTQNYTWTGLHTFNTGGIIDNASSTFTGAVTFTGAITGMYDYQVFTSSGTWTKPSNLLGTEMVVIQAWGGGGAGGGTVASQDIGSGGGAGGSYNTTTIRVSMLGSTETVTIGAGGTAAINTAGGVGGNTTFGSWLTAYGGGGGAVGGANSSGGGGGGLIGPGTSGSGASGGTGGDYGGGASGASPTQPWGGAGGATPGNPGITAYFGGGSGAGGANTGTGPVGGNSTSGGAGGAAGVGNLGTGSSGGTSIFGGNGGLGSNTTGNPGIAPAGGGSGAGQDNAVGTGHAGGAGARGEIRVWVIK